MALKDRLTSAEMWTSVLCVLLLCSVALNVVLSTELKTLQFNLMQFESGGSLPEGAEVPTLTAIELLSGETVTLSYDKPTVLYVFSPTCAWCDRNLDNVRYLAEQIENDYVFRSISLVEEGLRDYVTLNDIPAGVYWGLSPALKKSYKLGGTPQTLVISEKSVVLKNWVGAYSEEVGEEIEEYFGVELPGIIDPT